jgi:hypothetical protein
LLAALEACAKQEYQALAKQSQTGQPFVSDESPLLVTRKKDDSSLILTPSRSSLVARGRHDASLLIPAFAAEPEERTGLSDELVLNRRPWEEVRQEAEKDSPTDQTLMAFYYSVTGKPTEALKLVRKVADQGYAHAQFFLGWMYDNPYFAERGVIAQDYIEAAKWYRKAAIQAYAEAQFNLGVMLDKGEGVAQDFGEAVTSYRKAADQSYAKAQFNLD